MHFRKVYGLTAGEDFWIDSAYIVGQALEILDPIVQIKSISH